METLAGFLDRVTEQYGDQPALLFKPRLRTEVWSYNRLRDESHRMAFWLREHGIQKGDRIVLWAPNNPWWAAIYFGVMRLGAILVPLDIRSSEEFVDRVIEQSDPQLAILSRLTGQSWKHAMPTALMEDLAALPTDGVPQIHAEVSAGDVAEIIFTSGTTGDPKGVVLTHANITSDAASVSQVIPDLPYFRLLSVLPLSHMLEQTVGLLLPLGRGASVFYPSSRQSTALFRAFKEHRITTVILVPQALQLFIDAIEREVRKQGKEGSWRRLLSLAERVPLGARRLLFRSLHQRMGGELAFFVSGGAPLDPELIHRWQRVGIRVLQGYGATETSPVITATSFDDPNPASVGRAIPGVQVKIAPDGEVLVQGPNVTSGYWRNPEATQAAFEDGWYRTGDLGEIDEAGYLHLRGRKKNLIVLANGQNVYPEDVERALIETGEVADAVVLGRPTPQGAEVHAVLLSGSRASDPGTVVRDANAHLAPHQHIQGFTVWPEEDFPRTHTLKVKRQEVLTYLVEHEEGTASAVPSTPAPQATAAGSPLVRLLSEASGIPAPQLTPEKTLGGDCNLDSLGRVELLAAMEAELGIYIDEALITPETTLAELEALIHQQEGSQRPEFATWTLSPAARLARRLLQAPLFKTLDYLTPLNVRGTEALREVSPPVLFVANHVSHLDSPTLLKALPARLRRRIALAAAADYFFESKWLGILVGLFLNAFPFSRTTAVRPTLEYCATLLDQGWSILLYPEGTRSTSGEMAPFKSGVGLLAVDLDVAVVPVHVEGLYDVLPKGRTIPRRGDVSVTFGPALRFAPGTPYAEAAARIEEAVRSLARSEEKEAVFV